MRKNTRLWGVGDIVIHAREAKEKKMLRVVTKVVGDKVHTEYAHPELLPLKWAMNRYIDLNYWLHDPHRYGINLTS